MVSGSYFYGIYNRRELRLQQIIQVKYNAWWKPPKRVCPLLRKPDRQPGDPDGRIRGISWIYLCSSLFRMQVAAQDLSFHPQRPSRPMTCTAALILFSKASSPHGISTCIEFTIFTWSPTQIRMACRWCAHVLLDWKITLANTLLDSPFGISKKIFPWRPKRFLWAVSERPGAQKRLARRLSVKTAKKRFDKFRNCCLLMSVFCWSWHHPPLQ